MHLTRLKDWFAGLAVAALVMAIASAQSGGVKLPSLKAKKKPVVTKAPPHKVNHKTRPVVQRSKPHSGTVATKAVPKNQPDSYDSLMRSANEALKSGNLDLVKSKAEEALLIKKGDPTAQGLLTKLKTQRHDDAIREAQGKVESDPDGAESDAKALLLQDGTDEAAKKVLDQVKTGRYKKAISDAKGKLGTDPDGAETAANAALVQRPNDPTAVGILAKITDLRYSTAIGEAQKQVDTSPDAAVTAANKALLLKPNDAVALGILDKVKAGHEETAKRQAAIQQAESDATHGFTAKAAQEYKAIALRYPKDTALCLAASTAIQKAGDALAAADLAEMARESAATDSDRTKATDSIELWRPQFETQNIDRLGTAIDTVKSGHSIDAIDDLVRSCRLMAERSVGLATEWLGDIAAGRPVQAAVALTNWIGLPNRKPEDVGYAQLSYGQSDLVHKAVTDSTCAKLIADALGAMGASQIEAAVDPVTPGFVKKNPKTGADMVWIPAGWFLMGDRDVTTANAPSNPPSRVFLPGYWIGKTPVTVAEFQKFDKDTKYGFDWVSFKPSWGWVADHPMVNVRWADARAYCQWAGGDLPTAPQWTKAARGIFYRKYPWGNDWDDSRVQFNSKATAPVGTHVTGDSPFGCLDMVGNVAQWSSDTVGGPEIVDPYMQRIFNGAGASLSDPKQFAIAVRFASQESSAYPFLGFRLAGMTSQ